MSVVISNIKTAMLPKQQLAYVRHVGPYKGDTELFGRLFGQVMQWAQEKGLMDNPKLEAITVYHDDPSQVPEEKERISVGFTVPPGTNPEGDIQILEIPEGAYVVGSFEILPQEYGEAWEQVFEFIGKEGLKPTMQMCYESYKNDPQTHPEGKHLVDICVGLG